MVVFRLPSGIAGISILRECRINPASVNFQTINFQIKQHYETSVSKQLQAQWIFGCIGWIFERKIKMPNFYIFRKRESKSKNNISRQGCTWGTMGKFSSDLTINFQIMKAKIITIICAIIGALALFVFIPAEAPTGELQILWSGSWLFVFWLCSKGIEKYGDDER